LYFNVETLTFQDMMERPFSDAFNETITKVGKGHYRDVSHNIKDMYILHITCEKKMFFPNFHANYKNFTQLSNKVK